MILKKLSLRNIRSYDSQEISFPSGSTLLSGEIGSGKTTILLAIEYALFGLQPGQKGSALLKNGCDIGEVSLEFELQGKTVLIDRKLRRTSKSISNEYAAITIDGEMIETSVTELKTKILELLGYPPEFVKKNNLLYRYTVYTPQEEMKQIILEDSETRLNILRHVFGVDKYKRIRENLEAVLFDMRDRIRSLQAEIKDLERFQEEVRLKELLVVEMGERIRQKTIELSEKVTCRKGKESEIKDMEAKIKEKEQLEKEVEKTKILLSSKRDAISSLLRQKIEIAESIKGIGQEFREDDYTKTSDELAQARQDIEKLHSSLIETAGMIASYEQQITDSLSKKERVFKIDICPTCLQDVSEVHKSNIMNETDNEISAIKKRIELLQEQRKSIMDDLEVARAKRAALEDEKLRLEILRSKMKALQSSKDKLEGIEREKSLLEKDVALLMKHIDSLKASILKFSTFDIKFRAKQDELRKSFREEKEAEITLAEVRKESEMMRSFIEEIRLKISEKERSKETISILLEMHDWLSTHFINLIDFTERNILLKLRREFSMLFNNWFHMLAGESFEVRLDENFTPLIVQGETEMDYSFLSGGERTSLALAYRLALNQIINSVMGKIQTNSLIILDEPTDGFSESQVEKMREVFSEIRAEQVLIVSHDPKIEGFVDHIIRLRKEGGISVVEPTVSSKTTP